MQTCATLESSLVGQTVIDCSTGVCDSAPPHHGRARTMLRLGELLQMYLHHLGARTSRRKYEQVFRQYFDATEWRDKPADHNVP